MANSVPTVDMITREAVRQFVNSNGFLTSLDAGYFACFPGATLPAVQVSLPVAVAMGAAAAVIRNPVVSRRFWSLGT